MNIYNYTDFITLHKRDETFKEFFNYFLNSDIISLNERRLINDINIDDIINENFYDKLKTRYDKAKIVSKDMNQKAKDALEKVVKAANKATDFLEKIKSLLDKHVKLILTNTKDKIKLKLKSNQEFVKTIKTKISSDKSAFLAELEIMKEVIAFYQTKFYLSLESKILNTISLLLTSDDKDISISEKLEMITEGSNMIDKLVHRLNSKPPFSWLEEIQKIGEKGSNLIIKQLSLITNKLGGPYFDLPVIASLLGIAFEYNIKGLTKHGLLDIISEYSVPFIGIVVRTVGYIATMIATYEVIKIVSSEYK